MGTLTTELRNRLERVVVEARDVAEIGARAALESLAVHEARFYPHMSRQQQELRNRLRARARQLGDQQDRTGKLAIKRLVHECAYEHWHRMLFARFLAENGLLIEPQENMAISLAEAEELAKDDGVDVWVFASRCAQRMLPQIFRPEDPLLQISFAMEHRVRLEKLLESLPRDVFTASDSLGWVYQFWQSKKKEEVNRSEVKIGADEISAVTQLFTEPYMVLFLLHNTLGAWWAGRKLTADDLKNATGEEELRSKIALPGAKWEYLRFVRDASGIWRPAAGTFEGWPKAARDIKVLDPCCGSGHFLVAALYILVAVRMAEEGLSAREAVDAVLRDNLHGLEIDERCCQIAAFALAFAAWTHPDLPAPAVADASSPLPRIGGEGQGEGAIGYRSLPDLHIACTGIGPQCTKEQWLRLAEEAAARGGLPAKRDLLGVEESLLSAPVKRTLEALYELFAQAPILGSLINPRELPADLFHADYRKIAPLLSDVLSAERTDDEIRERAIAAAGMAKASELLADAYTLVATNVPYLGRGDQNDVLKRYIDEHYRNARADLATAFLDRSLKLLESDGSKAGTAAIVVPQNWLFLTSYRKCREELLQRNTWHIVARLGPAAFRDMNWWAANTALLILSALAPRQSIIAGFDVSTTREVEVKAALLRGMGEKCGYPARTPVAFASARGQVDGSVSLVTQVSQLTNPDARIVLAERSFDCLLGEFAEAPQGIKTGDDDRYRRFFWECIRFGSEWRFYQSTPDGTSMVSGMSYAIDWTHRGQQFARLQGQQAWGRNGVAVGQMNSLPRSLYWGDVQDSNINVIVPRNAGDLPAIAAFVLSDEFAAAVRMIDQKVAVTNATMVKVPFDVSRWRRRAAEVYAEGLPDPETEDPTQWPFHGHPSGSRAPLQVAVARLLGYRWPAECPHPGPLPGGEGGEQSERPMRLSERARALVGRCGELARFADNEGIVCIPSVRGEEPAVERLAALLSACGITADKGRALAGGDLDDWLRNSFFEEHCKLFHDRPFIWHIWDGRKRDGFHALVNYHKLAEGGGKGRKLLETLTYSYLGEWIVRQRDGVKRGEGGAEDRLAAALELQKRLEAILEGEPPFDIFIRWKPLAQQAIGWEPDINGGVRPNIRPFLASDLPNGRTGAGVLRWKPNIKWGKDRGKEPERPRAEYPWFWGWDEKTRDFMGGKTFDGNRWNACHYTNKTKQAGRAAGKGEL